MKKKYYGEQAIIRPPIHISYARDRLKQKYRQFMQYPFCIKTLKESKLGNENRTSPPSHFLMKIDQLLLPPQNLTSHGANPHHSGGKIRKKVQLKDAALFTSKAKFFVFDFFFRIVRPRRGLSIKRIFSKTLILSFDVIVPPLVHSTHYLIFMYCTIFPF